MIELNVYCDGKLKYSYIYMLQILIVEKIRKLMSRD